MRIGRRVAAASVVERRDVGVTRRDGGDAMGRNEGWTSSVRCVASCQDPRGSDKEYSGFLCFL